MHGRKPQTRIIDPEFLLNAYRQGSFPMAESRTGEINWYSPDPRGIIPLGEFKISRSLGQTLRKRVFEVRFNTAFDAVINECGKRDETWISEIIERSYLNLHHLGFAHSVEAWSGGNLVGGLYGVSIGGAFFGESMFSIIRDASKVALAFLVDHLTKRKFSLIDIQFLTPHLAGMGAKEIPRPEYLLRLQEALRLDRTFIEQKDRNDQDY